MADTRVLLAGPWELRRDNQPEWKPVAVPGCWEQAGVPMTYAGPCWYRTTFSIPAAWAGRRLWLHFSAVSYHCAVLVNGQALGEHTGMWDAFTLELTNAARLDQPNELLIQVEKPAGLTAGPDSARLPGRFPLRETLAGFLPYVWGHCFGGIWQEVELIATGAAAIEDVLVRGTADGTVEIAAATSAPTEVTVEIYDPTGPLVAVRTSEHWTQTNADKRRQEQSIHVHLRSSASNYSSDEQFTAEAEHVARFELRLPAPRAWSPADPALYTLRIHVADGDERVLRFGLRSLRAEGSTILLNERPIYPRMILSWGWYPEALHSNPGRERVRADMLRLKQLGYNGIKLCLWFPPQYYFELADELGMLLWVELPMWIPQPSAFFREQTPREYERLMRLARNHPAVILYTLGCELSRVVDAGLLAPLYALAKAHAGDALVRDNSGSGEAYGGLLHEYAEFYDHHFYSELHLFRSLLDYFAPRGRAAMPWLLGEYCDYDTFRDLQGVGKNQEPRTENRSDGSNDSAVLGSQFLGSSEPWWLADDPAINPQGARWQMDAPKHAQRLRASGLWERRAELVRISEQQGLWHRKHTIEQTRLYYEVSGYVITGEADTPSWTAGMWDQQGRLKFDPAQFCGFNGDLALLLAWDRRRDWVAGGDRPAPWDVFCYAAGASIRPHIVAAHYGAARGPATVRWLAALAGEPPFAQGRATTPFALAPGALRELAVAELTAPAVASPRQATLTAEVTVGDERAQNSWPLWIFPREVWRNVANVALYDPLGRLADLARIAPNVQQIHDKDTRRQEESGQAALLGSLAPWLPIQQQVVIATHWSPALDAWVAGGGRAILVQDGAGPPGPLPTAALPFWREAIRLAEPHSAWGDFPLDDTLGAQLLGCAADCALDLAGYAGAWRPILRRLDARTMHLHEYAAELKWGTGRLIVSTLRLAGGQGVQPLGIARSPAAAYLLWCWARWLSIS